MITRNEKKRNPYPSVLEFLRSQGLLEEEVSLLRPTREVVRFNDAAELGKLTAKQKQALEVLAELREVESGGCLV
ncbi:MAG: hypothetical protein HC933_21625 [Pleurocapsa sp. SU_196_0]|nr:hypothetical protein [Pleurocapsa sp. SU_196_0]